MAYYLKNATIYENGKWLHNNLFISDKGEVFVVDAMEEMDDVIIHDLQGCYILPGLVEIFNQGDACLGYVSENFFSKNIKDDAILFQVDTLDAKTDAIIDDKQGYIYCEEIPSFIGRSPFHTTCKKVYENLKKQNVDVSLSIDIQEALKDISQLSKDTIVSGKDAFRLLYTYCVKENKMTLEEALIYTIDNVLNTFNVDTQALSCRHANFCVYDLVSRKRENKLSPYIYGKCLFTFKDGKCIYEN